MIIRMYPKNGLKGLQLLAQSNALGKRARRQSLCKGISFTIIRMLMPLQGAIVGTPTPRALPWAKCSLPLRGVFGQMRIIILKLMNNYMVIRVPFFHASCISERPL